MTNITTDLSGLSKQYAARDLPTHTKLKYREVGQGAPEEGKKDRKELRRQLDEREKTTKESKRPMLEATPKEPTKKHKVEAITNIDADEPIVDNDEDESDEEFEDDEDDTAALLAELERIKKERAADAARAEAERNKTDEKIRVENILKGNPLLNVQKSEFKVKRRWDDDVVFKNCAKSESAVVKPAFINDTLRSEFHKKFMDKYIK